MNPAELLIVTPLPDQSRYTVLEGNRRLAAVRALESPESIGDAITPATLKKIRKLSRDYSANPIEDIQCVVVRTRDEARRWIELRHTGENEGAGLVPWGSDESGRFKSRSGTAPIHLQALDFLQQRGHLTADSRRDLPTTSFKRLLGSPSVRSKLGVESIGGVLRLRADNTRVAKALMYIVDDLASHRIKVRHIYTKEQREQYATGLPSHLVVTPTIPHGKGPAASNQFRDAVTKSAARKTAGIPKKRDRLIPRDCVLSIPPGRIKDIYGELRKLSLENYTNAVSVLFRVFVELSVDAYLADNRLSEENPNQEKLRVKIESVSLDLQRKKKLNKQQGRAVRSANLDHSTLAPGVATLNGYVHNEHVFPAPTDLRQHWNSLQPFVGGCPTDC